MSKLLLNQVFSQAQDKKVVLATTEEKFTVHVNVAAYESEDVKIIKVLFQIHAYDEQAVLEDTVDCSNLYRTWQIQRKAIEIYDKLQFLRDDVIRLSQKAKLEVFQKEDTSSIHELLRYLDDNCFKAARIFSIDNGIKVLSEKFKEVEYLSGYFNEKTPDL